MSNNDQDDNNKTELFTSTKMIRPKKKPFCTDGSRRPRSVLRSAWKNLGRVFGSQRRRKRRDITTSASRTYSQPVFMINDYRDNHEMELYKYKCFSPNNYTNNNTNNYNMSPTHKKGLVAMGQQIRRGIRESVQEITLLGSVAVGTTTHAGLEVAKLSSISCMLYNFPVVLMEASNGTATLSPRVCVALVCVTLVIAIVTVLVGTHAMQQQDCVSNLVDGTEELWRIQKRQRQITLAHLDKQWHTMNNSNNINMKEKSKTNRIKTFQRYY